MLVPELLRPQTLPGFPVQTLQSAGNARREQAIANDERRGVRAVPHLRTGVTVERHRCGLFPQSRAGFSVRREHHFDARSARTSCTARRPRLRETSNLHRAAASKPPAVRRPATYPSGRWLRSGSSDADRPIAAMGQPAMLRREPVSARVSVWVSSSSGQAQGRRARR